MLIDDAAAVPIAVFLVRSLRPLVAWYTSFEWYGTLWWYMVYLPRDAVRLGAIVP